MKHSVLSHEFVDSVPEQLEEGRLYISIRYRTASHLCPCGCGSKVVTPIRPAKWRLTFDGDSISLYPSVGNWQRACRSHYWIEHNKIVWAEPWSDERIAAGRGRDAYERRQYFARRGKSPDEAGMAVSEARGRALRLMARLFELLRRPS